MTATSATELARDYSDLTPDLVLQAVDSLDLVTDARLFPLNSYENRVYQVNLEEAEPVIAKFYRPQRWTDAAILEEHAYAQRLADLEIPAVPPIAGADGATLHTYAGYRFALFRRQGGQAPEPDDFDQLLWLGRLLGRMHTATRSLPFAHRPRMAVKTMIDEPADFLLAHDWLPAYLRDRYQTAVEQIAHHCTALFTDINPEAIPVHGDCHIGNILWHRETGPWFVDFDDCITAPAVQDLWMLLAGSRHEQIAQFSELLEGYEEFNDFNRRELALIEPLRTMRMVHYAGWLARRWTDPAFPKAFAWFNHDHYWQAHVNSLEEQLQILVNEPFRLSLP